MAGIFIDFVNTVTWSSSQSFSDFMQNPSISQPFLYNLKKMKRWLGSLGYNK